MEQFDGTVNAGRKGVAYDWQAVLASVEAAKPRQRSSASSAPQSAE